MPRSPRPSRSTRPARALAAAAALGLAAPVLAMTTATPAPAATAAYTVRTLHFKVDVSGNSLGDPATCDIVGDVYVPRSASKEHRVPAILTTNGFGGSKDDQAGLAKYFASHGYAVLSYSGLGFGGSGCKITLDDPSTDGRAAEQLISYLGGVKGIAFEDAKHTSPAPALTVVRRDHRDHTGRRRAHDPRVGMIGGSYGGQIQFAAASVDPRLDTIIPMITWNDLSYSLGPNNTDLSSGVSARTPGAVKLAWGLGFSALGVVDGLQNAQADPMRLLPCPNFATFVCPALVTGGATGFFGNATVKAMRHASVTHYMSKIRIPTLLLQGQGDTLFNLNEAAATYRALRRQGTPVKMVWHSWGHSQGTPQPGEFDAGRPRPAVQWETRRVVHWFAHYLKGHKHTGTGPRFAWFRDWVRYSGDAAPAFAKADHFPVGSTRSLYLSGSALTTNAAHLKKSQQAFAVPPAGLPTSLNPLDALGGFVPLPMPETDLPGTTTSFTTPPLTRPWNVVGSPKLTVKVSAPLALGGSPATDLVLFFRVQDVAKDGSTSSIHQLIAPVRVSAPGKPFTVTMPAFVHRFASGHRIQLVVAGGSINYRGGVVPTPVSITTGAKSQVLRLPVTN
jgi:ABC-2 type transport system ATP-binding protein